MACCKDLQEKTHTKTQGRIPDFYDADDSIYHTFEMKNNSFNVEFGVM